MKAAYGFEPAPALVPLTTSGRGQLIAPALLARDVTVLHIQPNGSLIDAANEPHQLPLF